MNIHLLTSVGQCEQSFQKFVFACDVLLLVVQNVFHGGKFHIIPGERPQDVCDRLWDERHDGNDES